MAMNFSELTKDMIPQIQETLHVQIRIQKVLYIWLGFLFLKSLLYHHKYPFLLLFLSSSSFF